MKLLFSVAWRNLWRHRRRTGITALAMGIGVAVCLAMFAFTDGMFRTMSAVLVDQQLGHVQVHHPDYPGKRAMHDTIGAVDKRLAALDGLDPRAMTVRLNGFGLLGGDEKTEGGQLIGILPDREAGFSRMAEKIVDGRYLSADRANEAIIGHTLATKLDLAPGGELLVVTQAADGSLGNALLSVVGTFRSGDSMLDRAGAYAHLADLQDLLVLDDQAHVVMLLAEDPDDADPLRDEAGAALDAGDSLLVQTWQEASPQTAEMMAMSDIQMGISIFIVLSLAALGVLNTMLMAVFERTRELGVMKAVGMRPRQIVTMVVIESVLLGALACVAGLVLGGIDYWLVVYGIDFSVDGKPLEFMGIAFDAVVRGAFDPSRVPVVLVLVFFVSVVASLWPAWRASRLRPVAAVRHE